VRDPLRDERSPALRLTQASPQWFGFKDPDARIALLTLCWAVQNLSPRFETRQPSGLCRSQSLDPLRLGVVADGDLVLLGVGSGMRSEGAPRAG